MGGKDVDEKDEERKERPTGSGARGKKTHFSGARTAREVRRHRLPREVREVRQGDGALDIDDPAVQHVPPCAARFLTTPDSAHITTHDSVRCLEPVVEHRAERCALGAAAREHGAQPREVGRMRRHEDAQRDAAAIDAVANLARVGVGVEARHRIVFDIQLGIVEHDRAGGRGQQSGHVFFEHR